MPTLTEEERAAQYLAEQKQQLAVASALLADSLNAPARKEMIYESVGSPKVLLRILEDRDKPYFCVIEIEGIVPYRSTTIDERERGILSLEPPAVRVGSIDELVASGSVALQAALYATAGYAWGEANQLGPGDLAMLHYRAARAIRQTLRLLGEDI